MTAAVNAVRAENYARAQTHLVGAFQLYEVYIFVLFRHFFTY